MCGIAGFIRMGAKNYLIKMNQAQRHRGPDEQNIYWNDNLRLGLASSRLAIVDLEGGHQPMTNEDSSVVVTYNGELFNAPELRKQLLEQGIPFATHHSDTEVVLRAYEKYGAECVSKFNGMFAFVILDLRRNIIFGARDQFGIKPLFYHKTNDGIAWASELKSLFVLPSFSRESDPVAVRQFLGLQYIPGDRTAYHSAAKLLPGHSFVYDINEKYFTVKQYHSLLDLLKQSREDMPDSRKIRDDCLSAVKRWSISDVPMICSLSGGLDSAIIVAALARIGVGKVSTFSLGFTSECDACYDELVRARQVAEMYSTDHVEVTIDVNDIINDLPDMVKQLDEPYAGGLPSWYIYKEISRQGKVCMTGTGGDELFSNYNKYAMLENSRRVGMSALLKRKLPAAGNVLSVITKDRLTDEWAENEVSVRENHRKADKHLSWKYPYALNYHTAHGVGFNERVFVSEEELSEGRMVLQRYFDEAESLSLRNKCVYVDFSTQLPEEFLFVTDRFSMAHSVEARTPFLDKDLVSSILTIPAKYRLTPDSPKSLLARSFEEWIPKGYAGMPKKGFVLPLARWLRGKLRDTAEDLFSESMLKKGGYIREDFGEKFYKPFLEGQEGLTDTVWTVFMFQLWSETANK